MNGREIKAYLKSEGIDTKLISVSVTYPGYEESIHATIKSLDINLKQVERLLNEKYRSVDYDQANGEILAGGNTYVSVNYDYQILKDESKKHIETAESIFNSEEFKTNSIVEVMKHSNGNALLFSKYGEKTFVKTPSGDLLDHIDRHYARNIYSLSEAMAIFEHLGTFNEQEKPEPPAPPTEPKQTAKPATVAENATVEKSAIVQNEVKESKPETAKSQKEAEQEAQKQPPKEPQTKPTKINITYSTISETTAKRAKEMNSYSDYISKSATNSYKSEVDKIAKIAQDKAEQYPEEVATIQNLLDRYSRKLAEWYNRYYSIECRCPSMMNTGAGNFPTNKKNKQNSARESHMKALSKVNYLVEKIEKIGTGPIKSNDENAIDKLQNKLDSLQTSQEFMKNVNAYYRKNKTLDGCEDITDEQKNTIENNMRNSWRAEPKPFASYSLSNNNACIRATKQRLEELKKSKEQPTEDTTEKYNTTVCKVVENTEIMRIQLIFDGKPDEETRKILKSNAFRYAPSQQAWQRQLTSNGKYAAKRVIEKLEQTA